MTLDGHLPHGQGAEGLTIEADGYKEIEPISFKENIIEWLDFCLFDKRIQTIPIVCATLKQYVNSIKRMCGMTDNKLKNNIANIIGENSESMRTACNISENINLIKQNMLLKLLSSLEKRIKEIRPDLKQLNDKFDYKYNDYIAINQYYKYNL